MFILMLAQWKGYSHRDSWKLTHCCAVYVQPACKIHFFLKALSSFQLTLFCFLLSLMPYPWSYISTVDTYFCYSLGSMISNTFDVSDEEILLQDTHAMWSVFQMPNWIQPKDQEGGFVTGIGVELTQFRDLWLSFFIGSDWLNPKPQSQWFPLQIHRRINSQNLWESNSNESASTNMAYM